MKRVRLVDVAAHAGVSMKTVANVVNGAPHVREATRQRVQAAVDELGYRAHEAARSLAGRRTGTIGMIVPLLSVPYFAELVSLAVSEAQRRGYRMLIQQTISDPDAERNALTITESGLVDGVLLHPAHLTSDEIAALATRAPVVMLGEGPAPENIDRVMIDNVGAARDATELLIAAGRVRLRFLGRESGPTLTAPTVDRIAGFCQALQRHGLPDAGAVIEIDGFDPPHGARAVTDLLSGPAGDTRADRPEFDGIVCRDDGLALGALRALRAEGIRVPEDVALIGWDDDLTDDFLETTLSTVRPDKGAIVKNALQMLWERIDGYDGPGRHVIAPHRIVTRESVPVAHRRECP